jgi:hypothetical protein
MLHCKVYGRCGSEGDVGSPSARCPLCPKTDIVATRTLRPLSTNFPVETCRLSVGGWRRADFATMRVRMGALTARVDEKKT